MSILEKRLVQENSIDSRHMSKSDVVVALKNKAFIRFGFKASSFGTIFYLVNGAAHFPKECVKAFMIGSGLQLDNCIKLTAFSWLDFSKMHLMI